MRLTLFLLCLFLSSCNKKNYPVPDSVLGDDHIPFTALDIDSVQIITPAVNHAYYPLDSMIAERPDEREEIRGWVQDELIKKLPDVPYTEVPFLYEDVGVVNRVLLFDAYYKRLFPEKVVASSGIVTVGKKRYSILLYIESNRGRFRGLSGSVIVIDNWKSTFEFYKSEEFRRKPLKKANYELVVSKLLKEVIEGYPFDDE